MTGQTPLTVLDSLNQGLHLALRDDPQAFLLGEDVLDPYGGAFKVTRGLSSAYPERVLTTPISEAGITGIAGGMALRGMHPVVEIMFGDFTTLIADQVINHITKFSAMYDGQASVPIVIRTPMGGRRGYGPTHSQTLEKLFLGVPGLTVIAPFNLKTENPLGLPGRLLYDAVTALPDPVFFVENKLQYLLKLLSPADLGDYAVADHGMTDDAHFPFYALSLKSAPSPQVTLAAYGYMANLALDAIQRLAYEHEIFCELMVPTRLAPFELSPLFDSVDRTNRLLAIEEGPRSLGWGAEILARTAEALGSGLAQAGRIAAQGTVIPAGRELEKDCLPDVVDIIHCVREMVQS